MKYALFLASTMSFEGCASKDCPARYAPAVEVLVDAASGMGGAGGECGVELKVTDLESKEVFSGCDNVSVGSEPGTYRLRIEYGDQVEERTVEVPASTGECGGAQTVTITAFER